MRSNPSAAVAALFLSSLSYGQGLQRPVPIFIDESKIRAYLERDSTVILIFIASFASQPVKAELALAWLRTDAHAAEAPVQTITIPPGQSTIETPLALGRSIYKPRDRASLNMQVSTQDGKPVEAALGLAIVDQAVLERARPDGEFGRRRWFACAFCNDENEAEISGVRLNDLYALKPDAPITPELDLVAEALVSRASAVIVSDSSESVTSHPFPFLDAQMVALDVELLNHYAKSLEFPEDEATLFGILGPKWSNSRDLWDRPYRAEFGVKGQVRTITILSSGPDKQVAIADDFEIRTFTRSVWPSSPGKSRNSLKTSAELTPQRYS